MRILNTQKLKQNIESRAADDIEQQNISGISVAVMQHDQVIYKDHFGTASFATGAPMTDHTLFRLASMTKPITAAAIMTLCEQGRINLDDPIEEYLPIFQDIPVAVFQNGEQKAVYIPVTKPTIRHLLTHSSGLLGGEVGLYYADKMTNADKATLDASIDFYAKTALSFVPGTNQEYSGIAAFDVLGKIVEVVTNRPFDEYVREKILDPLGMHDTTFSPTPEQWKRLIQMHEKVNGKSVSVSMPAGCVYADYPAVHNLGGAGLVSSVNDYMRFAAMLLNNGEYNGRRILQEKSVKQMATPQLPEDVQPGSERWGLGMRVITDEAYRWLPVGSYGWCGAYGTHFWVDPVNRVTAIYLRNSIGTHESREVTRKNFEQDVYDAL